MRIRLDRTICSAAGMAGMTQALGVRYATEPEQFRHSKLILAWGANILGTNVHLWPFIMEARRNGAKLYTIDPRRKELVWRGVDLLEEGGAAGGGPGAGPAARV